MSRRLELKKEKLVRTNEAITCNSGEELVNNGFKKIKALVISKIINFPTISMEESSGILNCLIIKRWDKGNINIWEVEKGLYNTYCAYPEEELILASESQVLYYLDKEIS